MPVNEMMQHRETLEESFGKNPPHTLAEGGARIKEETRLERPPPKIGNMPNGATVAEARSPCLRCGVHATGKTSRLG